MPKKRRAKAKRRPPVPGRKPGRPLKSVNVPVLIHLAEEGATNEEIALILGISADTLTRRFADVLEKARAEFKMSIRRQQVRLMKQGNATMAIWLGKNVLGQKDKVELAGDQENPLMIFTPDIPRPDFNREGAS